MLLTQVDGFLTNLCSVETKVAPTIHPDISHQLTQLVWPPPGRVCNVLRVYIQKWQVGVVCLTSTWVNSFMESTNPIAKFPISGSLERLQCVNSVLAPIEGSYNLGCDGQEVGRDRPNGPPYFHFAPIDFQKRLQKFWSLFSHLLRPLTCYFRKDFVLIWNLCSVETKVAPMTCPDISL